MLVLRILLLSLCSLLIAESARAQNRTVPSPNLLDLVAAPFKDSVTRVMQKPSVSIKYAEPVITVHPHVYSWLLDHPDRVYLAWTRINVPCAEIKETSPGKYVWTDEHGSEVTWQVVGRCVDGVVWYASGKVKPAALLPMTPVKAVAHLTYSAKPTNIPGVSELRSEINLHFQTDSRAAIAILRMLGPAAPKLADQGAEQLLFFFSGIAEYIYKNPERCESLLSGPKSTKPNETKRSQ